MNRRQFLKLTGAIAAISTGGIALLREEELWQPSKLIMLPPPGGWLGKGDAFLNFYGTVNSHFQLVKWTRLGAPRTRDYHFQRTFIEEAVRGLNERRYVLATESFH